MSDIPEKMETIAVGGAQISRTAVLAPMAGVADRAYRLMCRRYGAAMVTSEMVSAKGIVYSDRKTAQLCSVTPEERPMAVHPFQDLTCRIANRPNSRSDLMQL